MNSIIQSFVRLSRLPRNVYGLRMSSKRLYSADNSDENKLPDIEDDLVTSPSDDLLKKAAEIVEKAITKPTLPKFFPDLPALSVSRRPVFPGFYKTLSLKDVAVIEALQERLSTGKVYLGLFMRRDVNQLETNPPVTFKSEEEVHGIGVVSQLINIIPSGKDSATAVLYPHRRIGLERIVDLTSDDNSPKSEQPRGQPYPTIQAHTLLDGPIDFKSRIFKALSQEIFVVLGEIAKLNPFFREHITHHNVSSSVFDDPSKLADFIAVLCSGEPEELQEILSDTEIESRMRRALTILKKELQTAQLQNTISRDIEQKLGQKQKEFFLNEQLKAIKKELGLESDAKEKLLVQYSKAKKDIQFPEAVAAVFDEEMARLGTLETSSSEFALCRNYLDWLSQLPWSKITKDSLSVVKAKKVLNDSHSGMDDVKDRIVEFVAVSKLKGSVQGKILCFVGPPGVGKTSIGRAIAEALERKFYRFSVGGLNDVAEIKGHRRTYVGAMPGKLIQALKRVQSSNPVILIDEVDKVGRGGIHGDPTSALLEVLDPEQNYQFSDHYLDVPFDLSKVLFICTANVLETIPPPLLDRMEIITLSGYTSEEKIDIAKKFLLPNLLRDNGMNEGMVKIDQDTLLAIMKGYCREAGVRSLKNTIDRLLRKVAVQQSIASLDVRSGIDDVASDSSIEKSPNTIEQTKSKEHELVTIKPEDLEKFLGPTIFRNERIFMNDVLNPGLSTGLAWTASGGSILYIETVADEVESGKATSFKYTGQLGKVMEESCQIAHSYAKLFLRSKFPKNDFFNKNSVHIHVPEGAVPKDGPSAGCAITVSLLSAALGRGIKSGIALTGELTLTGKVLPVGGIREKVAAAKRAAITTVILPKANSSDWQKLPEYIREGMTVHLADDFESIATVCGLLE